MRVLGFCLLHAQGDSTRDETTRVFATYLPTAVTVSWREVGVDRVLYKAEKSKAGYHLPRATELTGRLTTNKNGTAAAAPRFPGLGLSRLGHRLQRLYR